ncbi:MAG: TolB family protein, partial [Candidatus Dormibacteria bacterium]
MSGERGFTADDALRLRSVVDPQLSPDGTRVAYVVAAINADAYEYENAIWVHDVETGVTRQFTRGPRDSSPRWSPDGQTIAFLRAPAPDLKPRNRGERDRGVDRTQLFLINASGGEPRQLTHLRHGADAAAWSPDGRCIAFSARVGDPDDVEAADAELDGRHFPRIRTIDQLAHRLDGVGWTYELRSHLFVTGIGDEAIEPRQLTEGDANCTGPCWSPDGRRIAFQADRTDDRWRWPGGDLWVIEGDGSKQLCLTDGKQYLGEFAWSPDSRMLAFAYGARRGQVVHEDLGVVPADGSAPFRCLTAEFLPIVGDAGIDDQRSGHGAPQPWFSSSGEEVVFTASSHGSTRLWTIPLSG